MEKTPLAIKTDSKAYRNITLNPLLSLIISTKNKTQEATCLPNVVLPRNCEKKRLPNQLKRKSGPKTVVINH